MRIRKLLLFAAFLAMSGVAMAQTTITSGMKFVPAANSASLTYYYTNAAAIGGFQMVVSLPDGVTLEEDAAKTAKGLSINGGEAASATFYNVSVPSGFECIGVKADADGTTSDGTSYKKGDILLVCFPVKAGAEYEATKTPAPLCTLTLTTSDGTTEDILKTVDISGFAGSDSKGTGGAEAAAKYAPSSESVTLPAKVLTPDVNMDKKVNGTDIQTVINFIVDEDDDAKADVNKDGKVNGTDIQEIINIIVNEE
jgi:hypothetical protein